MKYILFTLGICAVLCGGVLVRAEEPLFEDVGSFAEQASAAINDTAGGLTGTAQTPVAGSNQNTNTQTTPVAGSQQNTDTQTTPTAGSKQNNPKYLISNPLGKTMSLQTVVVNVVKVVQILLIMAAVLYIIWAGFLFVSAKGDTAKITKARNALLWGFVGVALVLGAQVIVTTIKNSVNSVFTDTTK